MDRSPGEGAGAGAGKGARRPVSRVLSAPRRSRGGARDDHSSGTRLAARLARPTRMAGRECPWQHASRRLPAIPIRSCSRWGLPCRPRCRRRGALLPHRFTLACSATPEGGAVQAVCSLWHFPWGRPRRPLAGTVFPWSPDFPPEASAEPMRPAAVRPSGAPHVRRRARRVNRRGRAHARTGDQSAPTARATAARRASVPVSACPVTASGRQCRWNAASTARSAGSSAPSGATA